MINVKFTTTDQCTQDGVKVLIYGCAGVGKTRLSATAPKPLIVSAESGLLSLRKETIPVIEIATLDDLHNAYLFCKKDKRAKHFETICIDSLSEIADVVLSDAKEGKKDKRLAYGEMIEEMMITIKKFRDLKGFNVYFSAREFYDKDIDKFIPDMPGKMLGAQLAYFFDEVFRYELKEKGDKTKRYLRTKEHYNCDAKDRSGSLNKIEQPNLTAIFNKIKES